MKKLILLLIMVLALQAVPAQACAGARPLGMGGAFIALADDINALYWNPAGLVQLESFTVSYSRNLIRRDEVSLDDYVALGAPWELGQIRGATGLSYTRHSLLNLERYLTHYLNLGMGVELAPGFSSGVNLRYMYFEQQDPCGQVYAHGHSWQCDLGFHLKTFHPLQLGLLVQNINRPEIKSDDPVTNGIIPINLRPGAALHLSPRSVITLDVYNILGKENIEGPHINLGWEHWWTSALGTRAGYYKNSITLGFSVRGPNNRLDYSFVGGDYGTHYLGVSHNF